MDLLSYFALVILFLVILILCYGMIAIHDIPYHMALKRNHPHADAIHAAPEIIFDQNVGDLFVIRTAGNLVNSKAIWRRNDFQCSLDNKNEVLRGY